MAQKKNTDSEPMPVKMTTKENCPACAAWPICRGGGGGGRGRWEVEGWRAKGGSGKVGEGEEAGRACVRTMATVSTLMMARKKVTRGQSVWPVTGLLPMPTITSIIWEGSGGGGEEETGDVWRAWSATAQGGCAAC